jgi:D-aspartate ligase
MVRDDYPHGQLGCIRSLGRLGVPVYPVHETRWAAAALSRFRCENVVVPLDEPPADDFLDGLLVIGRRLKRPVLVTVDDVGALFVAEHQAVLSEVFRLPQQPPGLPLRLADKSQLSRLCSAFAVPTPRSVMPTSRGDVEAFAADVSLPVIVKTADPRLLRRRAGESSTVIARSADELFDLYDQASEPARANLLLQEYVPGGREAAWILGACFGSDGSCLTIGTGRKLREHPPGHGATSLARTERNEELEALAVRFFEGVGYRGVLDSDWRWDGENQRFLLLDVNPRVGANFRLLTADHMDVVRALYVDLTGQAQSGCRPVPDGRVLVIEPFDFWSVHADGARAVRWWRWARQVVGADEKGWWARDDPLPAVGLVVVMFAKAAYGRLRHLPLIGRVLRSAAARRAAR